MSAVPFDASVVGVELIRKIHEAKEDRKSKKSDKASSEGSGRKRSKSEVGTDDEEEEDEEEDVEEGVHASTSKHSGRSMRGAAKASVPKKFRVEVPESPKKKGKVPAVPRLSLEQGRELKDALTTAMALVHGAKRT